MTETIAVEDRLEITDLITDFFAFLDAGDTDALQRLFSEDARLDMGIAGRPVSEGRGEIGAGVGRRPPGRAVRHLWSSLRVFARAADGGAAATFQVMVYEHGVGSPAPARMVHLCDTDVTLARDATDKQWRFTSMTRTVIFVF